MELNYKIAAYLRAFYIRNDENLSNKPLISVLFENETKIKNINTINKKNGLDFFIFSSNNSVYNYKSLFGSELESIAMNVSASYFTKYNPDNVPKNEELIKLYFSDEIGRKSNRSNALHFKYKLYTLGFSFKKISDATESEINESINNMNELIKLKSDDSLVEMYSRIKHDRWTAYHRTEGYTGASIDTIKKYMKITGNHKYLLARFHGCICSWEELGEIDKALNKKFQSFDSFFINDMLDILGINTKKSVVNISNLKCVLIRK